jgi:hypothetical protein
MLSRDCTQNSVISVMGMLCQPPHSYRVARRPCGRPALSELGVKGLQPFTQHRGTPRAPRCSFVVTGSEFEIERDRPKRNSDFFVGVYGRTHQTTRWSLGVQPSAPSITGGLYPTEGELLRQVLSKKDPLVRSGQQLQGQILSPRPLATLLHQLDD